MSGPYTTEEFIAAQLIALARDDLATAAVLTKTMTRDQLEDAFETFALALTALAVREGLGGVVQKVLTEAGVGAW